MQAEQLITTEITDTSCLIGRPRDLAFVTCWPHDPKLAMFGPGRARLPRADVKTSRLIRRVRERAVRLRAQQSPLPRVPPAQRLADLRAYSYDRSTTAAVSRSRTGQN